MAQILKKPMESHGFLLWPGPSPGEASSSAATGFVGSARVLEASPLLALREICHSCWDKNVTNPTSMEELNEKIKAFFACH